MASVELKSASAHSLDDLASICNRAFAGYIGRIPHHTAETMQKYITSSFVDLDLSRVFYVNNAPSGFALIAKRYPKFRLAAMGIVPESQGKGVGTAAMKLLVEEARVRGDAVFELEVIEQNTSAVHLYRRAGFETMRRLIGWECESPSPVGNVDESLEIERIPIQEVAKVLGEYGDPDLPWQLAGFSLGGYAEPSWVGFRLGAAYAVISNPEDDVVRHMSCFVLPERRLEGQATRLLNALFTKYPGKKWSATPLLPVEYSERLATKFGFRKMDLNQLQMRLNFEGMKSD